MRTVHCLEVRRVCSCCSRSILLGTFPIRPVCNIVQATVEFSGFLILVAEKTCASTCVHKVLESDGSTSSTGIASVVGGYRPFVSWVLGIVFIPPWYELDVRDFSVVVDTCSALSGV